MLLADAAQTADGKLYILGGGWSITGPGPSSMAVALKVGVPWDQANRPHQFVLALLDGDGHPVELPVAEDVVADIRITGELEVGRPVGLKPGTPLDVPLAVNIGPLPLMPGGRYVWRLSIDGETHEEWQLAFDVRPLQG